MPETGDHFGAIVFLFVLAGLVAYAWFFRSPRSAQAVPDGPEGEPYRVYTTAFDLELRGEELVGALPGASLDARRGHLDGNTASWPVWARRAEALVAGNDEAAAALLADLRAAMAGLDPRETVAALLIDQSGSMQGEPMARAAAAADLFVRLCDGLGLRSEILGFTTAGWWGGRARVAWKKAGKPERPGRLCALLHVVYKAADDPALTQAARAAMVHPDLPRENVDGEALLWASNRLLAIPARHRLLLVMSDGAPVDDTSMLHNGRLYLHRHLLEVIPSLAAGGLVLGGIGINHRVEDYYPLSEAVTSLPDLPEAMARVLGRMLGEVSTGANDG